MMLYLGQDIGVPEEEVIGIFDIERTTADTAGHTRRFLYAAEKGGRTLTVAEAWMPKSFTVCCDREGRQRVVISHLSPATLRRRAETPLTDGETTPFGG